MENYRRKCAGACLQYKHKAVEIDMTKKIAGIFLILIASGVWLYLDLLNKQELGSAEQIHQSVETARVEAKKRADMKENFENLTLIYLNHCQVAAEDANNNYMEVAELAMEPRKSGKKNVPQILEEEAEKIKLAAMAVCQKIYNGRLQSGL